LIAQRFVGGLRPDGYLEVDAARLLLILDRFAHPSTPTDTLPCKPEFPFVRHFAPQYYLQKLDFLLRYPRYFAYELIDLHAKSEGPAADRSAARETIIYALRDREPEMYTEPFLKFMRGAYERLDNVESWWSSRRLVHVEWEIRTTGPPWKHYFVTPKGLELAGTLKENVEHAKWYAARIGQIHRYMGHLSASELKARQYRHEAYSQAQYHEHIPDLPDEAISGYYREVFGEVLGVSFG
jgi:hypothetical protein